MTTVAVPGLPQVKSYLGASGGASDQAIQSALAAEQSDQATRCRVDLYNDALAEALKRRVARNLAMKGLPIGVQTNEFGSTSIGSTDPEVRRLEAPYRRMRVG